MDNFAQICVERNSNTVFILLLCSSILCLLIFHILPLIFS